MNDSMYRLKKWEIALILAFCLTLGFERIFGVTDCCAWWGTMYPELSPGDAVAAAKLTGGEDVVLRLQLLEWIRKLLGLLR